MARLTGPFMSLSASGTLAKTLTASIWKGQPYMRLRVIPINRNSAGQKTVRSVMGTLAKACRAVLTITEDIEDPAAGSQFFQDAVAVAPAGQSWISYLQKVSYGEFAANKILFDALDGDHEGYWTTTALTLGLADYTDKAGVTHVSGELLYMLGKFATTYLGYDAWDTTQDEAIQDEITAFGVYVQTSTEA